MLLVQETIIDEFLSGDKSQFETFEEKNYDKNLRKEKNLL